MDNASSHQRSSKSLSNGLPGFETAVLKFAFKAMSAALSDRQALRKFRKEATKLIQMAEESESYDVFRVKSIPRVMGIEESSCHWSVMMIIEHVRLVTSDILEIVKALLDDVEPRGNLDLQDYKPGEDVTCGSLTGFKALDWTYFESIDELLESRGNLATSTRYRHPWFGRLDAHQWHCLAAAHLAVHRRQAQKLIAMLGVT
ncbi:MAG: hypothetical protein ACI87E_000675 [Mariniblastus sp.]